MTSQSSTLSDVFSLDQAILDAAGAEPLDCLGLTSEWDRVSPTMEFTALEDLSATTRTLTERFHVRRRLALHRLFNSNA